ncbi:hypothetical protein CONLIGDRAFT_278286 [Coniochaeta ligniaria NRRL 30616]|uniref:Uncharacterized protein n=1 Tax=Coniochaeta ligniaria NRRL 30616 TaxID=1408157 RepID=A0A1J7J466_9PEZI|nr:hypothetical protein CONLIGDRAFT_278286 [Coniochaeta ligniaria NRRL 30616]
MCSRTCWRYVSAAGWSSVRLPCRCSSSLWQMIRAAGLRTSRSKGSMSNSGPRFQGVYVIRYTFIPAPRCRLNYSTLLNSLCLLQDKQVLHLFETVRSSLSDGDSPVYPRLMRCDRSTRNHEALRGLRAHLRHEAEQIGTILTSFDLASVPCDVLGRLGASPPHLAGLSSPWSAQHCSAE